MGGRRSPESMTRGPSPSGERIIGTRVPTDGDRRPAGAGFPTWAEALLFARALQLCRLAKGAGGTVPVPQLAATLVSTGWLPLGVSLEAADRAASRASRRAARWFGSRDTCLVRSLVTGALLSDHDDVVLHVGLAGPSGPERVLEGHAWITVGGAVVGGPEAAMDAEVLGGEIEIAMRRRGARSPSE